MADREIAATTDPTGRVTGVATTATIGVPSVTIVGTTATIGVLTETTAGTAATIGAVWIWTVGSSRRPGPRGRGHNAGPRGDRDERRWGGDDDRRPRRDGDGGERRGGRPFNPGAKRRSFGPDSGPRRNGDGGRGPRRPYERDDRDRERNSRAATEGSPEGGMSAGTRATETIAEETEASPAGATIATREAFRGPGRRTRGKPLLADRGSRILPRPGRPRIWRPRRPGGERARSGGGYSETIVRDATTTTAAATAADSETIGVTGTTAATAEATETSGPGRTVRRTLAGGAASRVRAEGRRTGYPRRGLTRGVAARRPGGAAQPERGAPRSSAPTCCRPAS